MKGKRLLIKRLLVEGKRYFISTKIEFSITILRRQSRSPANIPIFLSPVPKYAPLKTLLRASSIIPYEAHIIDEREKTHRRDPGNPGFFSRFLFMHMLNC
ncbi:hypothetical protein HanRHA438_Chr12g0567511 [Helianthus annuus]|nr:hypothetical protein HanRHA438_Chr12g0567511 [Helianthus annuus]